MVIIQYVSDTRAEHRESETEAKLSLLGLTTVQSGLYFIICYKFIFQTIYLLLMKTSDTNRFIRMDASAALDACSEHLSVAR